MSKKRHPWASGKTKQKWLRKWFHCARWSCMERAVALRVLARPHAGPAMTVWVCPRHAEELDPAR